MLCRLSLSRKDIATEGGSLTGFYNASLVYVSMSEEANIKLAELVGEHFISCGCKDPGYFRHVSSVGWDSVVGIATRYGLDGPGI